MRRFRGDLPAVSKSNTVRILQRQRDRILHEREQQVHAQLDEIEAERLRQEILSLGEKPEA